MNPSGEVFWNSPAATEGHGQEQDADWLREVGLDFVLDDVLGSSGGTHHHQHSDGSAPPVAPPPAARSYDVRNVFDPAAHQNAGDASDGRRGEMRLSTAAPPSGRAPPGPLWKNHWNQYDAIATPDVKGVAVLGFKMKGTLRGPPAEAASLTPPEEEEDEDESPVAVQPGVDWTLQPGFNDSFSLGSQDQELPVSRAAFFFSFFCPTAQATRRRFHDVQ
ncbi:hypothetical protein MRX96_011597 [Rhipicephalus microplus]